MKNCKKLLSIIVMIILVLAVTPSNNAEAASIKLNKKSITITKGKTYTLKVKGTKKKAKWSSSKKSVATVSKKGKVTGKKRGSATITAKIGKKKYKCKVKVETPSLSATKKSIAAGSKYTLKLNGCSRSKKFYTSNNSVAAVSSKGVVTAKKQGTAKITVKISDKSYYCIISVYNQLGTRTNPANPRNGVTVKALNGTMYFKLTKTYRGTSAVSQLISMGEWGEYEEEDYAENPGTTLVLFEYDVKAISGYSKYPLKGLDIINSYDLYNGSCTQKINRIEACYLNGPHESQDNASLMLYSGASSKMHMALYVPNGMTSFSNTIQTNSFGEYWVKYTF
ncbi:Ig-like domain-containing protein [Anaerostipes sp.]|uniref:Ig-like domain-containing protein n=1 Tax=Anaerostipes sp. TaxID=1872530 RepID=UPI0025B7F9D4|nr:Ig-like domain-containing protein [Anaerostipes sp.]MBS7008405.1 Ig-like domain-containing protein [Anaerostipes sp.]